VATASVLAVFALGLAGVLVYEKIGDKPRKQTAYADLRLGMTMAEVKYVKGYPTDVLENPGKENGDIPKPPTRYRIVLPTKALKSEQHVEDYRS
jgi:hypothetical protein